MIGDIIVGALLLISGFINVLAIGAFWITPSLRTTANRFVINLLLVNFISCLILSPFAFNVNAKSHTTVTKTSTAYSESFIELPNLNNGSRIINATDVVSGDMLGLSNRNITTPIECLNDTLECLETASNNLIEKIENISLRKYQTWSLDLVVALSVLSVLLVILDTFIAVTDPLRYHARISDCKAWLFIVLCWILSIAFGIASAIRADNIINVNDDVLLSSSLNDKIVYNMMFLLTYFLLIIITPFLLVILMYWRIYSEARESGQRMRQNGSSPLLQSALNLAATANAHQQQSTILTNPQCLLLVSPHHHHQSSVYHGNKQSPQNQLNKQDSSINYFNNNSHNINNQQQQYANNNDGLTMKIDKQDYHHNNNNISQQINLNLNGKSYYTNGAFSDHTKTFLLSSPPHECAPMITTTDESHQQPKSQQHQNILLTLTTVCDQTIKRNHSVKHLHHLNEMELSGSDAKIIELRQVQSTPNLQTTASTSSDIIVVNNQEHTLELPSSIQASPKALRYMTSLRHRLSNASSLFKYREEGRAARISILGKCHFKNISLSLS